jgi:superfamily II DNA/RNA helicase
VYTLYLPADDPREYVHLAGRVGRVGQRGPALGGGGRVVSILREDEAGKMEALARTLGFEFTDIDTTFELVPRLEDGSIDTESADFEKLRRLLEDTLTLVDLADDPVVNVDALRSAKAEDGSGDDGDDDDEDDEEDDEEDDFEEAES